MAKDTSKGQPSKPSHSVDSIRAALKKLTETDLSREHYEHYVQEAKAELNDRGAAILISTNLENVLRAAIENRLQVGPKRSDLFGNGSPMGVFDFKIRIGEAIKLFGPKTKRNLSLIKDIRNTFAHAKIPIRFSNQAVLAACSELTIPTLLPPVARPRERKAETEDERARIQGRSRFMRVCNDTAHNLFMLANMKIEKLSPFEIKTEDGVYIVMDRDVWVAPKPLP